MKTVEISKRACSEWFAMALVATLLLPCSGVVYAQKNKDKTTSPPPPPPARSAPAPAPAARPAAPASQPARTAAPVQPRSQPPAQPSRNPNQVPSSGNPNQVRPSGNPNQVQPSGNPNQVRPSGNPNQVRPSGNPNQVRSSGNPNQVRPSGDPNQVRPGARPEYRGSNGSSVLYSPSGHPTVVHTSGGATIFHAPGGGRTAIVARPGGRVIVTNGRGHGYVQRPIAVRGGRTFVQRTYYVRGSPYARFYRPVVYRGVSFNVYTPVRFYSPRFYAWGYTPWRAPVIYSFGWGPATPWFGFYGGYFTPYPSYAGPNFWLTDYMLAASLQDAYQERFDAAGGAPPPYDPSGQVAVNPQVKNMIAQEVRWQLDQESRESQTQNVQPVANAAPPIFADGNAHVFVASSSLIVSAGGQECGLTSGDVLQLNPSPSADPTYANVQVLASKGQDCATGQIVPVQLADLQEMQNHMRETIDQGLGDLQAKQGQGNLPQIDPALRAETPASYSAYLPAPEADAENELQQSAQETAGQEEAILRQAGPAATAPPALAPGDSGRVPTPGPPTVSEGQTIDQVLAAMGQPDRKAKVANKDIYVYKDMKITFVNGKVTDIQ
ncbi:MAG: hypothetical protein LAQ69_41150 [Acidobacteriia bacterium]|nr:hypothetical protein [Terriglobia bacterium]